MTPRRSYMYSVALGRCGPRSRSCDSFGDCAAAVAESAPAQHCPPKATLDAYSWLQLCEPLRFFPKLKGPSIFFNSSPKPPIFSHPPGKHFARPPTPLHFIPQSARQWNVFPTPPINIRFIPLGATQFFLTDSISSLASLTYSTLQCRDSDYNPC